MQADVQTVVEAFGKRACDEGDLGAGDCDYRACDKAGSGSGCSAASCWDADEWWVVKSYVFAGAVLCKGEIKMV